MIINSTVSMAFVPTITQPVRLLGMSPVVSDVVLPSWHVDHPATGHPTTGRKAPKPSTGAFRRYADSARPRGTPPV